MIRWLRRVIALLALLAAGTIFTVERESGALAHDWRTASSESVGVAPEPGAFHDPVIQVYAARAWGWRGYFGVHTWISTKRAGAAAYDVHEVIGWRAYRDLPVVARSARPPDGRWFGSPPELLLDLRGPEYEAVIDKIDAAIKTYPYNDSYTVWPGPNSNTFVAHVAREVPELRLDLPPTAIGKDYLGASFVAETPSGSGFQVSLLGLLGVMIAEEEGLEVNFLGLTFGIDPLDLALKLPGIGRIGADE